MAASDVGSRMLPVMTSVLPDGHQGHRACCIFYEPLAATILRATQAPVHAAEIPSLQNRLLSQTSPP